MFDQFKKYFKLKNRQGFTLIEMLVVMAIFATTILMASNLYFVVLKSQRQIISGQKIQSAARFSLEAITRELRMDQLDYTFYDDPNGNGDNSDKIDLGSSEENPTYILAVRNQDNQQIIFRKSGSSNDPWDGSGDRLEVCLQNLGDTSYCNDTSHWQAMTSQKVKVIDLKFYIYPFLDPFTQKSCYNDNDCPGTACDSDGLCVLPDDQPRVTISLTVEKSNARPTEQAEITVQTSVSLRTYRR